MRLYYGTYGHHLSGKLYVYWGGDNLRTGQQVLAPVTNKQSGKTYNTMFTISRAQSGENTQGEIARLTSGGIKIKTLGGRDLLSLPGGKDFESKAAWERESEERYRNRFPLPSAKMQNEAVTPAVAKTEKPSIPMEQKRTAGSSAPVNLGGGVKQISVPKKKRKKAGKRAKKAGKRLKQIGKALKNARGDVGKAMQGLQGRSAADSFKQKGHATDIQQREAFIGEEKKHENK